MRIAREEVSFREWECVYFFFFFVPFFFLFLSLSSTATQQQPLLLMSSSSESTSSTRLHFPSTLSLFHSFFYSALLPLCLFSALCLRFLFSVLFLLFLYRTYPFPPFSPSSIELIVSSAPPSFPFPLPFPVTLHDVQLYTTIKYTGKPLLLALPHRDCLLSPPPRPIPSIKKKNPVVAMQHPAHRKVTTLSGSHRSLGSTST